MAMLNHAKKELSAKIVYYGPGLSGKTTNLEWIHRKLAPEKRGKLISLETKTDRTLFFDFLPVQFGDISGYKTKFNVYTVPGQIFYNETRRVVLKGVDGVVFVADSQKEMANENLENLKNLADNLRSIGKELYSIPVVLQYNKRDLPNVLSVEELNGILNPKDLPFFEAIAMKGEGVLPALSRITRMVAEYLNKTLFANKQRSGQPISKSIPASERRVLPRPEKPAQPASAPKIKHAAAASPAAMTPKKTAPAPAASAAQAEDHKPPPSKGPSTVPENLPSFHDDRQVEQTVTIMPEAQHAKRTKDNTTAMDGATQGMSMDNSPQTAATMVPNIDSTAAAPEIISQEPLPELTTSSYFSDMSGEYTPNMQDMSGKTAVLNMDQAVPDSTAMEAMNPPVTIEQVPQPQQKQATPPEPPSIASQTPSPVVNISAESTAPAGSKNRIDLMIGNPERRAKNELNIPIALRLKGSKERISFQLSIKVDSL